MPALYHYYLGPPRLTSDEMGVCWSAPLECAGWIDLNHLSGQGQTSDRSLRKAGLFWTPAGVSLPTDEFDRLNSVAAYISDVQVTGAMLDVWEGNLGYRPSMPAGATLLDLLWEALTTYSTAGEDDDRCMLLMPTVRGTLDLHLSGHSLVRRERFDIRTHRHGARVLEMLHRQYGVLAKDEQRGRVRSGQALRVLDYARAKYRLGSREDERESAPWRVLLPSAERARVRRLMPHETTITESFDKGDSTTLGPDLSWTELVSDWETASNEVHVDTGAAVGRARADSDLSSDDHYAQVVVTNLVGAFTPSMAVSARMESTTVDTAYVFWLQGPSSNRTSLRKLVSGTQTFLENVGQTLSIPDTIRLVCDGSSISGLFNGSEASNVTDTAITSNLRCGLNAFREVFGDDFEAADLAVPATPIALLAGGLC